LFEIKTHERIVPYKCNNVMLLSGRITPRHSNSYTTRLFLKVSASATVIHKQVAVQDLVVQHYTYISSILAIFCLQYTG
jgi:hypothetical protein